MRLLLQQALAREHVFDLTGADAKRERSEGAVRSGVRISADDGLAWLGEAHFRADDMDDPLMRALISERGDAELFAVVFELADLGLRDLVDDRERERMRRTRMVDSAERQVRPADGESAIAEALEGLRGRHFVDQVEVDVNQRRCSGVFDDEVVVPDLFDDRAWFHCVAGCFHCLASLRRTALEELLRRSFKASGLGDRWFHSSHEFVSAPVGLTCQAFLRNVARARRHAEPRLASYSTCLLTSV